VEARSLAVIGLGKMGRAVAELAPERGWDVRATFDSMANRDGAGISARTLNGAAVAVEFTEPSSAAANVIACVRAGCPVVVGTTGWYDQLPKVTKEIDRRGGMTRAVADAVQSAALDQRLILWELSR
jgi:4-hydroxy-tetrahydrodipicolinate reductase